MLVRHHRRPLLIVPVACAALLCFAATGAATALAVPGDVLNIVTGHYGSHVAPDDGIACAVATGGDIVTANEVGTGSGVYFPYVECWSPPVFYKWSAIESTDGRLEALAVGPSGSGFAVGRVDAGVNGTDYLVLQAGSGGSSTKTYDGPAHLEDMARAVAVASDGSVYVTGSSTAADGDRDIVTIKYGPVGDQQWVKRFNSPSNKDDVGNAVAVRGTALYVAGHAVRTKHGDDVVLIKYDRISGKRLWTRYYDDALHRDDSVAAMVVTRAGVFLAGSGKARIVAGGDALLLRFASTGALRWAKYSAGAKGGFDGWQDVAVQPGGHVAVTGRVYRSATGRDIATASFSTAGTLRWLRTMSTAGKRFDVGVAVGVDKATGRVYVGGVVSRSATGQDMAMIAYSSSGSTRWFTFTDGGAAGNDWINDCCVSAAGVYAVGAVADTTWDDEHALVKYEK